MSQCAPPGDSSLIPKSKRLESTNRIITSTGTSNNETVQRSITDSTSFMENPVEELERPATNTFRCLDPRCIYSTSHKSNLRRHMMTMHDSVKALKMCCGDYFYSKEHYHQHLRTAHSNGFKCKLCDKYFKRKSMLSRHVDGIHGSLPHKHQCSMCPYSSSHKSNLQRHCKLKHQDSSETNLRIASIKAGLERKIWRPVPEIFSTFSEGMVSQKESKDGDMAVTPAATTSTNSSKPELIFPPKASDAELNTAYYQSATSISSSSNFSPSNLYALTDSSSEYHHKKLRWSKHHK